MRAKAPILTQKIGLYALFLSILQLLAVAKKSSLPRDSR